ncbi:uncharacterized protein LOC106661994 isoform X2 [Cimex lectularius]|nr:uncharacterized protein LOC106661994 isoform X2 [Cimex lectularius]XP_014241272.1 uncharacterized protein LOC106661994 isoform X2 [Cimex lectularius]
MIGRIYEVDHSSEVQFMRGFLIMGPFSEIVVTFCAEAGKQFGWYFANQDIEGITQFNLYLFLVSWISLVYAYISDNYIGAKQTLFIAGGIATLPPLVCFFSGVSSRLFKMGPLNVTMAQIIFYSGTLTHAFSVIWKIIAVEQVSSYRSNGFLRRYLTKLEILKIIGYIIGVVITVFDFSYFLLLSFVCLAIHLTIVAMLVNCRQMIRSEQVVPHAVTNYLIEWYKTSSKKINIRNYRRPSSVEKFQLVNSGPVMSEEGKHFSNVVTLIVLINPFTISYAVLLFTCMYHQDQTADFVHALLPEMDPHILTSCFSIAILLTLEYILIAFMKICRTFVTHFHLMGIVYVLVATSLMAFAIREQKSHIRETQSSARSAQLRIYNLREETIYVSSSWFPSRKIDGFAFLSILNIVMKNKTSSTQLNVYYTYSKTNETFNIMAELGRMQSCLISGLGFTMLDLKDSPDSASVDEEKNKMAKVHLASPNTKENPGNFVIWFYNMKRSNEIRFVDKNSTLFQIPQGLYKIAIRVAPNLVHFHFPNRIRFRKSTMYLMILTNPGQFRDNPSYVNVHSFPVHEFPELSKPWVFLQIFSLALAECVVNVYFYSFIYLESQPQCKTVILCLLNVSMSFGFGIRFLVISPNKPTSIYHLTFSFIVIISLFLFVNSAFKYKSKGTNKYVF